HCDDAEPKPLYYLGGMDVSGEYVIVELTPKCLASALAAAGSIALARAATPGELLYAAERGAAGRAQLVGLLVTVSRGGFDYSERVLRAEQLVASPATWPYDTRRELARIWGVPVKPRIFKEQA